MVILLLKTVSNSSTPNFETLTDGFSIKELSKDFQYDRVGSNSVFTPPEALPQSHPLCNSGQSTTYKEQTLNSIERALNFYENHLPHFNTLDSVVGLMILKAVDDKYGQIFQKLFPLANWLIEICSQFDGDTGKKCRNLPRVWKASEMKNSYKSWDSITKYDSKWSKELIANEKEYIWAPLNSECQSALVNRCEVPHVCERTFLDPEPRSQYFLTHQLLLRILIEQQSEECPSLKRFVDHDVNDQLCARMHKEAQLIANFGYPHLLRDIFSEHIAFCGHLGYPNFFREDFLQNILSWQSSSDYGCFRHEKDYKSAFTTSDEPLKRVTTRAEAEKGLESDEMCLPHFTAVGLSALAVNWDYMEENCG